MKALNSLTWIITWALLWTACSRSSTGIDPSAKTSATTFTANEYLSALRSVSLRATLALPKTEDVDSILAATDPKTTYETLVDTYVGSDSLRASLLDYFRVVFGMGPDTNMGDGDDDDDPARFATYLVMNDVPWSDLVTAGYRIDINGIVIQDHNEVPDFSRAGFMSMRAWTRKYAGNGFLFNYVREVARITECYQYPDSDTSAFSWDEANIGTKYLPSADINCFECHKTMNVRRAAWYQWNGGGTYDGTRSQGTDVYGHDSGVTEPRAGAATKFTDQITTAKSYGTQVAATDRFARCAARRFLSFALGYQGDLPGSAGRLMFDFDASSRTGDKDLLDRWAVTIKTTDALKIRTFLKAFFKSEDFIGRIAGL